MNTKLVWGLQLLLASYFIVGAVYMMQNYPDLASAWATATVPATFWLGLGSM